MIVSTPSGDEAWVTLGIMEQHQRSAPQDFASLPNESARNKVVGEHRFAMAIQVVGGSWSLPELRRPRCQQFGHALRAASLCPVSEKPFYLSVAVGAGVSTEEGKAVTRVAAEMPGTLQPRNRKKEQG